MWTMLVVIVMASSSGTGATVSSVPGFTSQQTCNAAEGQMTATVQRLFGANTGRTVATSCVRN